MPKTRRKTQAITVKKRKPMIEGLEDFPLHLLGLTPKSIEESNGHIILPKELLPYIKICRTPKAVREYHARLKREYELRLKAEESQKYLKRERKSPRKGGKH
jgi:hypothetical protein